MKYFLFPFAKVEKGNRVILYGAGLLGAQYRHQIKSSHYCELVLWIDGAPDGVETFPPETLLELAPDAYDLVIVAVWVAQYAAEMRQTLREFGVPDEKMLTAETTQFCWPGYSKLTLSELLERPDCIHAAMRDYFTRSEGYVEYFRPLIDELKAYKGDKVGLMRRLRSVVEKELTENSSRLVLLRVMYEAECFDAGMMELFMRCVAKIRNDVGAKYWLTIDMTMMTFYYPHLIYPNYYLDRRSLFKAVAEEYGLKPLRNACRTNNSNRICFIQLSLKPGNIFPPTMFIAPIANELAVRGYEVTVIPLDAQLCDLSASFLKPEGADWVTSKQFKSTIRQWFHDDVKLIYLQGASGKERRQFILDTLYEIDPKAILDCSSEFCPISFVYHKQYPTIYIPMGTNHSSSFFHRLVVGNKRLAIEKEKPYRSVTPAQMIEIPPYYQYVEPKRKFNRTDHGLFEHDFIMVTVGLRLKHDITEQFADAVCGALLERPRLKWILVGAETPDCIQSAYAELLGKQIIFWGHEGDLVGLYSICDLYINPDRIGGGTSIAWAMQHDLAVTMTARSTLAFLIGQGYYVDGGYDSLMAYVLRMMDDPQEYARNRTAMRERAENFSLDAYVTSLIRHMDELCAEFAGNETLSEGETRRI